MITRLFPAALGMILLAPIAALPPVTPVERQAGPTEVGAFITKIGDSLVSTERFSRNAHELTGSIETRVNGRPSRATYVVLYGPTGRAVRLEYSLTIPQRGLSSVALDLTGDSAIGPVMVAERESFRRIGVPREALPLLALASPNIPNPPIATISVAMLEDLIRALRGVRGTKSVTSLVWGYPTLEVRADSVTVIDDAAVLVPYGGAWRVTLDQSGAIRSATRGAASGGSVTITRTSLQPSARVVGAPRSGLAATPPMGWNSWNKFGCRIDETLIRETADAMVSSGMLAAGYRYLNIDDCWEAATRDGAGNLVADSTRFPSGMKALVDYIHSKGLKAGIYSSGGTGTCQRRPASLDHEVADARLFAGWGIDYLKYDNCNAQGRPEQQRFKAMIDAVKATNRDIVISVCEWGEAYPWNWARQMGGHLWRTTEDIRDSWLSVLAILDQQVGLDGYAVSGGWNDPDMLEVGNGKMTYDQYVAHFSLWALLNAPLIAGNDVRGMSDSTRAILLNADVIAVNQDPMVHQGYRLRDDGALEVWVKPMYDNGWTVVLLNRGSVEASMEVTMRELDAARLAITAGGGDGRGGPSGPQRVRDLWSKQTAQATDVIRRSVPATGAVMLRISRGF